MKKETIDTEAITAISSTIETAMYGMTDRIAKCFEQMMTKMSLDDITAANSISEIPDNTPDTTQLSKKEWVYDVMSKEYGQSFAEMVTENCRYVETVHRNTYFIEEFFGKDWVHLDKDKNVIMGTPNGIMYHDLIHDSDTKNIRNVDGTITNNGSHTISYNSAIIPDQNVFPEKSIIMKRQNPGTLGIDQSDRRLYIDLNSNCIISSENLNAVRAYYNKTSKIRTSNSLISINPNNYNPVYIIRHSWYEWEANNENINKNKTDS